MDHTVLHDLPLFNGFSSDELKDVIKKASLFRVEKGAYFYHQEDPADRAFVLLKGRVKLSQLTPDGQKIILRIAAPVQVFAIVAVLPAKEYPVSAEAIEDCEALSWSQNELQIISTAYPIFTSNAMDLMARYLQDFQTLFLQLATERVEQRLARILLRLHDLIGLDTEDGIFLDMPLTRQELAEMCGTTLSTVSRLLSSWEKNAIVRSGRAKVFIKDILALKAIADY